MPMLGHSKACSRVGTGLMYKKLHFNLSTGVTLKDSCYDVRQNVEDLDQVSSTQIILYSHARCCSVLVTRSPKALPNTFC